jgi:cysteine desulfurase
MGNLRDRFEAQLQHEIPGLTINAQAAPRLPNTSSVSFPGVSAFEILKRIPELCASLGTACHSHGGVMSSTLGAMGLSPEYSETTIRFSLGWETNQAEIDRATSLLVDAWEVLRG